MTKDQKNEPFMDNPEHSPSKKKNMLDRFLEEQNVDPIPIEELNEKVKDEKNKRHSKDTSSSEKKYP